MPKGLTRKQKGFVKDYVKTDNATESAERNYDVKNRNVANNIGAENLAKPSVIAAIAVEQKTLADRIPDDLIERVHLEGLEAGREVSDIEGNIQTIPDYAVRHKYLDSAYKLKGSYAAEKSLALNVNVGLDNTDNSQLDSIREEFEQKLKQKFIDGT